MATLDDYKVWCVGRGHVPENHGSAVHYAMWFRHSTTLDIRKAEPDLWRQIEDLFYAASSGPAGACTLRRSLPGQPGQPGALPAQVP